MYIGIFFCLGVIFILISLFMFPTIRDKRGKLILFSISCLILGMVLFELASEYLGFSHYGSPASSNFPRDYLENGLLGWIIMILPILAVISPLIISIWLRKSRE